MSKETVRGRQVVIEFDGSKCVHSRNCVLDRPDVFVPNAPGDWIHPDAATPDEVMAIARNCPSGAIRAHRLDGGADEAAPLVNTVRVLENGPLAVRATLTIKGEAAGYRATLVSLRAVEAQAVLRRLPRDRRVCGDGRAAAKGIPAPATRNGTLNVEPRLNGPLKVTGPVEVLAGTGHTVNRGQEFFFCRCGQSSNKPYCDGTHKVVGFTAD